MQQPPVRSVGEVTSDLSTTTGDDQATTSTSTEQNQQKALAKDGTALPPSQPSVVCWEELSGYTGFKSLEVEAGVQASIRMFVLHTQQIFFRETKNYDELMCQVCRMRSYMAIVCVVLYCICDCVCVCV